MEFVCPNCHCRTQDPVAIDATDDEAYKQAIVANEEYTRNKNLHRLAASCIKETRIAWEIFTKKIQEVQQSRSCSTRHGRESLA